MLLFVTGVQDRYVAVPFLFLSELGSKSEARR
jgi:hypothetical protein